jgi:hypothetical protein
MTEKKRPQEFNEGQYKEYISKQRLTMRASVFISARIQSGQSKSPQKRNLWK